MNFGIADINSDNPDAIYVYVYSWMWERVTKNNLKSPIILLKSGFRVDKMLLNPIRVPINIGVSASQLQKSS